MESVPGADRGPRAGSPRGVVDATGSQLTPGIARDRTVTRSLSAPGTDLIHQVETLPLNVDLIDLSYKTDTF